MMKPTARDRTPKRWTWYVLLLIVITLVYLFRTNISDWVKLQTYSPSPRIEEMVKRSAMNDKGRHLFYINQPETVTKQQFVAKCPAEEKTIILGCYHAVQNGIYVLVIANDDELDGVMEVTAAHEMLHAAYDRLSGDDKHKVVELLTGYYRSHKTDSRIVEAMNVYRSLDQDGLNNEMHSILGTEVENLPDELEKYYAQYFSDRSAVVALANSYRSQFTDRENAVKALEARLKTLIETIDTNRTKLDVMRRDLDQSSRELNSLRTSNADAYNARVDSYNDLVRRYNSLIEITKEQISEYNRLVEERNKIAFDYDTLSKQLNGSDLEAVR